MTDSPRKDRTTDLLFFALTVALLAIVVLAFKPTAAPDTTNCPATTVVR